MWYEDGRVVGIVDFSLTFLIVMLLIVFGVPPWAVFTILLLIALFLLYNAYIVYNKAIDKTVIVLGEHYKKQIQKEINNVIKKFKEEM